MISKATTTNPADTPPVGIPDGFAAIPITNSGPDAPLRICVLCRLEPDAAAGHFIALPSSFDALRLLGCVVDALGCLHQWIDVSIQNVDGLAQGPVAVRDALSNQLLDERWRNSCRAIDHGQIIHTGWEEAPAPPTWLDVEKRTAVHPADAASGEKWQLCRDDALLSAAGLPPYSSSLHRYLWLPSRGPESKFVPVTSGAPVNTTVESLESLLGGGNLVPVNRGGLMSVRPHHPIDLASLFDLLSGKPGQLIPHGRASVRLALPLEPVDGEERTGDDAWLFMGTHGRWGRLMEAFHLKLRLLADAVTTVYAMVRQQQRPLLNIADDHFAVGLAERGCGLPVLWTARVSLTDCGDAIDLPIESSDIRYYLPGPRADSGLYRPPGVFGRKVQGQCAIRIRKILSVSGELTVTEGTFFTHERLEVAPNDLVWIRLPLGGGPIDLFAHLETETALAGGEWRFRTVGQRLSAETARQINQLQGAALPPATFELIPLLSTPCDLYSLGVLAVRALLVNAGATHATALDAMISLARQLAQEGTDDENLGLQVRALFESNKRWLAELGPQRLAWDAIDPSRVLDLVPIELWCDALAMVARMFPGHGHVSVCRDWGDADPLAKHVVFERTLKEINSLLIRTRSLIMIDWRFNREIHAVIRSQSIGLPAGGVRKRVAVADPWSQE